MEDIEQKIFQYNLKLNKEENDIIEEERTKINARNEREGLQIIVSPQEIIRKIIRIYPNLKAKK